MFSGVSEQHGKSKSEKEYQQNIKRGSQLLNEEKDPCIKENKMTYKCLDENNYDRTACANYFENYKRCKTFWGQVRVDRRRAGIEPNLPPAEEREKIKREYLENKRAQS